MISLTKCSDDRHLYQVRFICQHRDCENSFLCLACFQTHHQDTNCRGVYGVDIKEIEGTSEDAYEIITEATPVIKKENLVQEHKLKKTRLLERIQQVFDQGSEIHRQNGEAHDEFEGSLIEYLKTRTLKWKQDQVNIFRGESGEVFLRLVTIKEALENMEFDAINFSNSQAFKKLNNEIPLEVDEFISLAEQEMDSWKLNKERLNDYLGILCKAIEGVEFSSLFDNEKLEYDSSNLVEFSEDYKSLKKEIERLKDEMAKLQGENDNLKVLGQKNTELNKQVELLKRNLELRTTKRNELGAKVLQFEELVQNLIDENENLTRNRDGLAREKTYLTQANRDLIDERDDLKRKLQVQEKNDFIKAQDDDVEVHIGEGLFGDDDDF